MTNPTIYFAMRNSFRVTVYHKADNFREFASIIRDAIKLHDMRPNGSTRFAWRHIQECFRPKVCVAFDRDDGSYGLLVSKIEQVEYEANVRKSAFAGSKPETISVTIEPVA